MTISVSELPATLHLSQAGSRVWDVLVVGAGPAGALGARQAALGGASVLLVERKEFPRKKVCGACLNGKALGILRSVGLGELVERHGGLDLGSLHVRLGGRSARFPLPAGKAIGRDTFDAALVAEAISSGVAFLPETTATLEPGDSDTRSVRLDHHGSHATAEARITIVASGMASTCLEQLPQITTSVVAGTRIGAGCQVMEFPGEYEKSTIHMAVGRAGYVGLVRLPGDVLNVAAAFDRASLRSSGGPAAAAAAVLADAGCPAVPALDTASWAGTVGLTRTTRPVAGHRWFLVGDAGGYVEPFTGEGMGTALVSARAVAAIARAAAAEWKPEHAAQWRRAYARLVSRQQMVVRGLAAATRNPFVARIVFALAARSSAVSGTLIRRINQSPVLLETTT